MSELMRPLSFAHLMRWAINEYHSEKRVFGIDAAKFYKNKNGSKMRIFGGSIDSPVGPAAGPHSQLAQNIVAAFVAGSRFVELKTVQKIDGAEMQACIARPCINAQDEGYNVEWSTELTVGEALDEYIKAWIAIHVLGKDLGISDESPNCVFNMSVGYDLAGIQGQKIDAYIEGMKNAQNTPIWQESLAWLSANSHLFTNISAADLASIPPQVSNSITLSTLHGCPAQEIERIAKYLLDVKKVHTFVKCNPTLLGYEKARSLLDAMGYGYLSFDDHHFNNDLQYADAVTMLRNLLAYGQERGLQFGVKITNTFPVKIAKNELPGEEMYLSGRALFPLSINVASSLATDFNGQLPISYSGGADAFNIADIFRLGIRPITVATTILKPGGYERMRQLAEILEPHMPAVSGDIDAKALAAYVETLREIPYYRKEYRPIESRKTAKPLGLFDCFMAPCKDGGCPIQQQIPTYLRLVAEEKYDEAFRVIAIDNAAPSITGTICSHVCQDKCTRMDYETPLKIRSAKLAAAESAQDSFIETITAPKLLTDKKAAIIGAGPAGIAAALYLRRNGVAVTVFEQHERPFGIVEYVIPKFRIAREAMERDFKLAEKMGVEFKFGAKAPVVAELKKGYDYIVIAIGAWKECAPIFNEKTANTLDALGFLLEAKAADCRVHLGKHVAVIGGGDVAMDCARAAKRAPGVETVTLVYRRTQDFMPAAKEEIRLALADGVHLRELLAPLSFKDGLMRCEKTMLGPWAADGRRSVNPTGETVELGFDTVINATGSRVHNEIFAQAGIALNAKGQPQLNDSLESTLPGIYVAGDCKSGPATVVAAMADAKTIALDILAKLGLAHDFNTVSKDLPLETLYSRKGKLVPESSSCTDANRCLGCDSLCELCCDVCPNRANVRIKLPGFKDHAQILHIDALCNECGNCGIFCPHDGNPYKDKLTLFWQEEDFLDSTNRGLLPLGNGEVMIRAEDGSVVTVTRADLPETWQEVLAAVKKEYSYLLC